MINEFLFDGYLIDFIHFFYYLCRHEAVYSLTLPSVMGMS